MAQPPAPPKPPGSAYFEKKGEVHELRVLLRGAAADRDNQKKRDAIKKVIAYMTLGIDVSPLFSEMVMASATNDLVQKKMVYLYLVNYAESNSELAILAVNTLLKDCRDDDPMIRGLALRSLCSLSLMNMVEYLQPAVQRALEDTNGYVRKTAVIGVVKVFHISRSAVLDSDLLPTLKRLIQDSDAHVVGNAIVAVEEVLADEGGFQPTRDVVTNMLNRLQQFSEWGQCAVLRLLTKYQVADEGEMFDIMNILDSLLKQSSSAVVLAVTKIFLDLTSNRPDLQIEVLRRLKGPLLTLMAAATPELAYTVLVHIHAIVECGADAVEVFSADFKQFFCRYNDPSYIKNVKIDILTILADAASGAAGSSVDAKDIVTELSEYVTDVDAEISRRAIRAIGKIAVRRKSGDMLDNITEMIVDSLTDLLALDIDYVSTEAAVVMKDLVRKYPQQFQRASGAVERCMKIVNEPDGKCALLWILGEYGHLIEDAPYLLEPMIEGFLEEQSGAVRLEMLTAGVKLFFCRPPEMQAMLGRLLVKAIQESSHPDVRDRALLYYRLLEHSPDEARRIICAPKEVVEEFQEEMDQELKDRIFDEFNSLSTVYKQTAAKFVLSKDSLTYKMQPPPAQGQVVQDNGNHRVFTDEQSPMANGPSNGALSPQVMTVSESTDLLGGYEGLGGSPTDGGVGLEPSPSAGSDLLGMGDLLGGDLGPTVVAPVPPPFSLVLDARMDGVDFEGRWSRLPALPPQSRPMRPVAVTTSMVEDALRRVGIFVIASGTVENSMKFYFYAKQSVVLPNPETLFLMELIMVPGGLATCTLRVDNAQPSSVERLSALLWETLMDYVHS